MMSTHKHLQRHTLRRKLQGSTLIEVLVAALLLAVGMLSLAGLQATAMRLTKDAEFKATSSEIAFALSESIKANVGGIAQYATPASNAFVVNPPPVAIPTTCDGIANVCTTVQMAAQDLARIQELVRNRLPSGQIVSVYVAPPGGAPPAIDLWVAWLPSNSRSGDANVDAQTVQPCPAQFDPGQIGVQCQYFRIVP